MIIFVAIVDNIVTGIFVFKEKEKLDECRWERGR
jgi:hypothetical protein